MLRFCPGQNKRICLQGWSFCSVFLASGPFAAWRRNAGPKSTDRRLWPEDSMKELTVNLFSFVEPKSLARIMSKKYQKQ
jgi:hypothetical protein